MHFKKYISVLKMLFLRTPQMMSGAVSVHLLSVSLPLTKFYGFRSLSVMALCWAAAE